MSDLLLAASQSTTFELVGVVGAALSLAVAAAVAAMRSRTRSREQVNELRDQLNEMTRALRAERRPSAESSPSKTAADTAAVRPPQIDRPQVDDDLVVAALAGEVVLFAGAGLAAEAGYPLYADALELVIDRLRRDQQDETWGALHRQLAAGEVDLTGALLLQRIGEAGIRDALRVAVGSRASARTPTLDKLAALQLPGVITDDWYGLIADRLGRGALLLAPWSSGAAAEILRSGRRFVLEAYGGVDRSRLIVGFDDYRAELYGNRDYARFVGSVLTTRCLLFLGTSLRGVEEFVISSELRSGGERVHWAFVPWQPDLALQEERLSRYGVRLVAFDPEKPAVALGEVVAELRARVGDRAAPVPVTIGAAGKIEWLQLRHIGPFPELRLSFDGPRTILLGDNGCGKSSVLRAIALSLAGESPVTDTLAERMLKTDAPTGEIELGVGKDVFRTRLSREGTRVRMRSENFTPIQASAWLALGFPALRGVSISNPRGPTAEAPAGPGPDDLVPLLDDGPDLRLDSLKQWIVNTELRAADPKSDTPARQRYAHMRDKFFDIVSDLTPGVDFQYEGVNRTTWAVELSSPDGPLSFDLLSRGIIAVLGWVGVLLQRLYEVYDAVEEPWTGSVLVLVDEIDVHLHPDWQQRILPLLDDHFPGMQLIGTTHSPLLVGDVEAGEVISLRRDVDGIKHEVVSQSFAGWRSDQILTSPAFQLTSTRDRRTRDMTREYRDLLESGQTPKKNAKARELQEGLQARTVPIEETHHEREAAKLLGEWLDERLADMPEDERKRVVGAAQDYLTRLKTGDSV